MADDQTRDIGVDVARAAAVFGMVVVNFKIVMGAESAGPDWLVWMAGLLDGRAAATFVVLAGLGISLLSRRSRESGALVAVARDRGTLIRRAVFLFLFGLAYTPVWPGDILHFYGVYICVAAFFLTAPSNQAALLSCRHDIVTPKSQTQQLVAQFGFGLLH